MTNEWKSWSLHGGSLIYNRDETLLKENPCPLLTVESF